MLKPLLWKKRCASWGELVCACWILAALVGGLAAMGWLLWRLSCRM